MFDIGAKSLMQCYLMDEEMFVGDQRYSEPFIREFMDHYKRVLQSEQESRLKNQKMVKGLAGKIAPGIFIELEQEEKEEDQEGEYEEAMKSYKKSLEIREKIYGEEHPEVANSYNFIGIL